MSKVYVITSGSYSDYMIHRVFADKATAEAFCDRMGRDEYSGYDVEEYDLETEPPQVRDRLRLTCDIKEGGEVTSAHEVIEPRDAGPYPECESYIRASTFMGDEVYVSASGFDHDRVRKRYSELVAQGKADWHIMVEADRIERTERDTKYRLQGVMRVGTVYGPA